MNPPVAGRRATFQTLPTTKMQKRQSRNMVMWEIGRRYLQFSDEQLKSMLPSDVFERFLLHWYCIKTWKSAPVVGVPWSEGPANWLTWYAKIDIPGGRAPWGAGMDRTKRGAESRAWEVAQEYIRTKNVDLVCDVELCIHHLTDIQNWGRVRRQPSEPPRNRYPTRSFTFDSSESVDTSNLVISQSSESPEKIVSGINNQETVTSKTILASRPITEEKEENIALSALPADLLNNTVGDEKIRTTNQVLAIVETREPKIPNSFTTLRVAEALSFNPTSMTGADRVAPSVFAVDAKCGKEWAPFSASIAVPIKALGKLEHIHRLSQPTLTHMHLKKMAKCILGTKNSVVASPAGRKMRFEPPTDFQQLNGYSSLITAISSNAIRTVFVHGPPGIGKTILLPLAILSKQHTANIVSVLPSAIEASRAASAFKEASPRISVRLVIDENATENDLPIRLKPCCVFYDARSFLSRLKPIVMEITFAGVDHIIIDEMQNFDLTSVEILMALQTLVCSKGVDISFKLFVVASLWMNCAVFNGIKKRGEQTEWIFDLDELSKIAATRIMESLQRAATDNERVSQVQLTHANSICPLVADSNASFLEIIATLVRPTGDSVRFVNREEQAFSDLGSWYSEKLAQRDDHLGLVGNSMIRANSFFSTNHEAGKSDSLDSDVAKLIRQLHVDPSMYEGYVDWAAVNHVESNTDGIHFRELQYLEQQCASALLNNELPTDLIGRTLSKICRGMAKLHDFSTIVVYVPSSDNSKEIEKVLLAEVDRINCGLKIFHFYGRYFENRNMSDSSSIKIIFAPDAFDSIVIQGVKYVLDCGREKRSPEIDCRGFGVWTTKLRVLHRRAMASRLENGYYYAFFSKNRLDNMEPEGSTRCLTIDHAAILLEFMNLAPISFPGYLPGGSSDLDDFSSELSMIMKCWPHPLPQLFIHNAQHDLERSRVTRKSLMAVLLDTIRLPRHLVAMLITGKILEETETAITLAAIIMADGESESNFENALHAQRGVRHHILRKTNSHATKSDHITWAIIYERWAQKRNEKITNGKEGKTELLEWIRDSVIICSNDEDPNVQAVKFYKIMERIEANRKTVVEAIQSVDLREIMPSAAPTGVRRVSVSTARALLIVGLSPNVVQAEVFQKKQQNGDAIQQLRMSTKSMEAITIHPSSILHPLGRNKLGLAFGQNNAKNLRLFVCGRIEEDPRGYCDVEVDQLGQISAGVVFENCKEVKAVSQPARRVLVKASDCRDRVGHLVMRGGITEVVPVIAAMLPFVGSAWSESESLDESTGAVRMRTLLLDRWVTSSRSRVDGSRGFPGHDANEFRLNGSSQTIECIASLRKAVCAAADSLVLDWFQRFVLKEAGEESYQRSSSLRGTIRKMVLETARTAINELEDITFPKT